MFLVPLLLVKPQSTSVPMILAVMTVIA
jgi:hypothetical protein